MNAKQTEDLQRHFLQEHAEIFELATTLLRVLVEQQQSSAQVSHLFGTLYERVRLHFADEEAAGMFDQVVSALPHLADITRELLEEHGELVRRLGSLRDQACQGELTRGRWEVLAHGFREFSNCLRRHEVQEDDLLRQAYGEPVEED